MRFNLLLFNFAAANFANFNTLFTLIFFVTQYLTADLASSYPTINSMNRYSHDRCYRPYHNRRVVRFLGRPDATFSLNLMDFVDCRTTHFTYYRHFQTTVYP